jgi:hypothetical protein
VLGFRAKDVFVAVSLTSFAAALLMAVLGRLRRARPGQLQ